MQRINDRALATSRLWKRISTSALGNDKAVESGKEKAAEIKRSAESSPLVTSLDNIIETLKR